MNLVFKYVPDTWCPEFGQKKKNSEKKKPRNILAKEKGKTPSLKIK
jgi:hypothetical protein